MAAENVEIIISHDKIKEIKYNKIDIGKIDNLRREQEFINDDNTTHYIYEDNDMYLGCISLTTTIPDIMRANEANFYYRDLTYRTCNILISGDLDQGKKNQLLDLLMYTHLNVMKTNRTYLIIHSVNILKYLDYGFEILYTKNDEWEGAPDKIFIHEDYNILVYLENNRDRTLRDDIFNKIMCLTQDIMMNNKFYRDMCGVFVILHSLLIIYALKINNNKDIFSSIPDVSYIISAIERYLIQFVLTDENKHMSLFFGGEKMIGDMVKDVTNITGREMGNLEKKLSEINAIYPFKNIDDTPFNFIIHRGNTYLVSNWFNSNVIIVETGFHSNEFCNTIFLNDHNLQIMRNFFNLNNYVVTFIIGENKHWTCYTVNKVKGTMQYIYMDSNTGLTEPNADISQKIKNIVTLDSYDKFLGRIMGCFSTNTDYLRDMFEFIKTRPSYWQFVNWNTFYTNIMQAELENIFEEILMFFSQVSLKKFGFDRMKKYLKYNNDIFYKKYLTYKQKYLKLKATLNK